MGKGVYKEAKNLEQFGGKRVLVIDNGNKSIELAVELTKHTGRVVLVTSSATPPGSEDLQKELKRSDVKTLYQSEILKILGTDSIEKVKIHDMDEDENYELY
ncbi:MAG: iron-sulfur cluster assembly scaffold protein, partial [Promethearchaeia archaeon]